MKATCCAFVLAAAAAGSVSAIDVVIPGDVADFYITLPEGTGAINTFQGLAPSRLGTFRETRNPPVGRPEAERRAILQFDLASLVPHGDTITSADFSIYLPNQNSGVPTHDLDLWASSDNRAAVVNFGDAGAANEYADPSYSLVVPSIIPRPTPPDLDQRYSGDVTAYLQARYAAYLLNPAADRYVFFRTQVAPNAGVVNSFYELSSAEAGGDFVPRLEVTVVPSAGVLPLAGAGLAVALRRRRARG